MKKKSGRNVTSVKIIFSFLFNVSVIIVAFSIINIRILILRAIIPVLSASKRFIPFRCII